MKLSVIMLTYNRESLEPRMIECILAQTLREFEFIIVDNGSEDRSGEIADRAAKRDPRIRVVHLPCGNIGKGRNAGLDLAQGEYIGFVDDDDLCESDYLEFLHRLIRESDADVAICGAVGAETKEKKVMTPQEALVTLFWRGKYNVAFPGKLFRRELFEHCRFRETGKYDDIDMMPQVLSEAKRIAYDGTAKYWFERHGGNNSAWTQNHILLDAGTLREYLGVYDERTRWLSEKFPEAREQWEYFRWSFMLSMVEKVTRLRLEDCYEIRDQLIEGMRPARIQIAQSPWLQGFEKEWLEQYIRQ
ncbi:MAG: glycosyltransferase family 2 protein [Selenomonadaceae bacterium]|nr:glycosyltransferase family 2 protein [Selenomonadaceae bacterium]